MAARRVLAATLMRLLAKHGGEDVVEILLAVALLVGLLLATEPGIVAMLPELIVFRAPLLIFQDFPCFGEVLKFGFGIVFFTDVGVVLARQAAVGGLDGFQIVGWLHPENGIIILQFHAVISSMLSAVVTYSLDQASV